LLTVNTFLKDYKFHLWLKIEPLFLNPDLITSSRKQSLPRPRQLDTLLVFFIKFDTEVSLKGFKTLANRRCTHVHLSSGLSKVVVLGNRDEKLNAIEQHERGSYSAKNVFQASSLTMQFSATRRR
jgi:hypothetical protein